MKLVKLLPLLLICAGCETKKVIIHPDGSMVYKSGRVLKNNSLKSAEYNPETKRFLIEGVSSQTAEAVEAAVKASAEVFSNGPR